MNKEKLHCHNLESIYERIIERVPIRSANGFIASKKLKSKQRKNENENNHQKDFFKILQILMKLLKQFEMALKITLIYSNERKIRVTRMTLSALNKRIDLNELTPTLVYITKLFDYLFLPLTQSRLNHP